MRKPKVFSFMFLILLLTACIPGAATPVAPTTVDVDGIRTQAAGTAIAALTQQAVRASVTPTLTTTPTLRVMPDLCKPPAVHETPNFDRSD